MQPGSIPVAHHEFAQVGQARLAMGEGWGEGLRSQVIATPPHPSAFAADLSPTGRGETESVDKAIQPKIVLATNTWRSPPCFAAWQPRPLPAARPSGAFPARA